jgi:DNA polymerase I-like protein with 3'-5' exonuclease and polymerase domains
MRRFARIDPRFIWDTMLVDQAMFGGLYTHFSLSALSRRWLGVVMDKETRDEFEGGTVMTKEMKQYAALDVVNTLKIAKLQKEKFESDHAFRAYTEIDEPAIFPILDMSGFRVDVPGWEVMVDEFTERASKIQSEIGINVMSAAQVKNKAKEFGYVLQSTGADILKDFDHPFFRKVEEARMYRKASSTYGRKWLEAVEEDEMVYSSYKITGAKTGRMSSADPNLQNIPARKLPTYRSRFIASEGNVIMVSDVSQQEPRILAYESQDEVLIQAIKDKEDLHLTVAKSIFGEFDKSNSDYDNKRAVGKAINLGTSYGLTEFGLAEKLKVAKEQAAQFLKQYFTRFRGVFSWISTMRMKARSQGYVTTAIGRKIYINPHTGYHADNNAINSPIQGGAADFTKMWVRKIWELSRKYKLNYPVVAIVHDEIVCDVPKKLRKRFETDVLMKAFDETAKTLYKGIPFAAETVSGPNWGVKQFHDEAYGDEDDE